MRRRTLLLVLPSAFLPVFRSVQPAQSESGLVPVSREGKQPKVAVTFSGQIFVLYGAGNDILLRASNDRGKSYTEARKVAAVDGLMLGARRGPQIAATSDYVIVSAIGKSGDLQTWRSQDRGRTWEGPFVVNDGGRAAREGLHAIAPGAGNSVIAVWLDVRDGKKKLFGSRSTDGGITWLRNTLIYESPDGHVCECCHPSVASDGKGLAYVMWRNWLGGARDMYLAASRDEGVKFGNAQKLGYGTWLLRACPMDGGSVAVGKDGNAVTIWRRDNKIFVFRPGGDETLLGEGTQPVIATAKKATYMLWQTGDSVMLSTSFVPNPVRVGKGAYASVAASPSGRPIIAVWETKGAGESGIVSYRLDFPLRSAGAPWGQVLKI